MEAQNKGCLWENVTDVCFQFQKIPRCEMTALDCGIISKMCDLFSWNWDTLYWVGHGC